MERYDLDNLTEEEVMDLISYEKNPTDPLEYNEVYSQIIGTLTYSSKSYRCGVIDKSRKIMYSLNIHTTPVNTVFSIGLMIIENHKHLVRFDFGEGLKHTNNIGIDDEEVIHGSHVHFNSPAGKYESKNVVPIGNIENFSNIRTIIKAWERFIKYANILDK